MTTRAITIPKDFPVRPLKPNQKAKDRVTCGSCGRSWDDAVVTSYTPAPSARCPFEAFHNAAPVPSEQVETNPLERSEWSAGWGNNFVYFDFQYHENNKVTLHCAYDFNGKPLGNVTADLELLTVEDEKAASEAAALVERAVQWFREQTGHAPVPIQSMRNFIRAVQTAVESEGV